MKRKNSRKIVKERSFSVTHASFIFLSVLALFFLLTLIFGQEQFGLTGNAVSDVVDDIKDLFGISSLQATSVVRSFSASEYTPGLPLNVKLSVNLGSADKIINYGVEEYVPAGWTIISANSSDYSSIGASKISWIVNSSNNNTYLSSRELSYTIIPLSSDTGAKSFASNLLFTSVASGSAVSEPLAVSGATSINSVGNSTSSGGEVSSGSGGGGGGGGGSRSTTIINTSGAASTGDNQGDNSDVVGQEDNPSDESSTLETPLGNEENSSITYILLGLFVLLVAGIAITVIVIRKRKQNPVSLDQTSIANVM